MDIASLIGLVSGIFFIVAAIVIAASGDFTAVFAFMDAPSVMVVIGGTIASMLVGNPMSSILNAMKATKYVFSPPKLEPADAIGNIVRLANLARKEGILALEESARNMDDEFLQKGIMLIVDGTDPELTRNIMETELAYIDNRHREVKTIWENIASYGPAWGMVGTMVGLINMLGNLDDPSTIGPNMSVALVTTFYGSIVMNFIANPFASKLKIYSDEEGLMKEVLIEGMLSIQAGENPRIIEEKLKSFLSPKLRSAMGNASGAGE